MYGLDIDNKGKDEEGKEQRVDFARIKLQICIFNHNEGRLKNSVIPFRRWIDGHSGTDSSRVVQKDSVRRPYRRLKRLPV